MSNNPTSSLPELNYGEIRVTFLGGLGEIGRNCAAIEYKEKMLLIDCGLMFPNEEMPGVDLVLPDFTWLIENKEKMVGVVVTHGHEDHMGGLSYLAHDIELNVYGSKLTMRLAQQRFQEANLMNRATFNDVNDSDRINIGPFDVEFIPVTHSVPHGFAIAIHTELGAIIHTGDFKIDMTPVDGRRTDLSRIGTIATTEGVLLLLADSTNADREGITDSEMNIGSSLEKIFGDKSDKRIIVACFASHLHRIEGILKAARKTGRHVVFFGKSMARNVAIASELGVLDVPPDTLLAPDEIDTVDPHKLCVISTGSQGEPLSALSLLAAGEHRALSVSNDDVVILSSQPIPGNERAVSRVIDGLSRRGCEVIHSGTALVHASGHARRSELAVFHALAKPEWFIPVHGEYRHLVAHAHLARNLGLAKERALVCVDGDSVRITESGLEKDGKVSAGYLYVDGIVGDVGHGVLKDRKILSEEGVIVVVVGVDVTKTSVITGPDVITRGWVHADEAEDLLDEAKVVVREAIEGVLGHGSTDLDALRQAMRKSLGKFVSGKTKRRPMIVPFVMEI
ncbi:MAG: ribonuclease J [Acidimicrobiales bacterium]|nr:ribonuclease J [Acidimicrobiales bacterium]